MGDCAYCYAESPAAARVRDLGRTNDTFTHVTMQQTLDPAFPWPMEFLARAVLGLLAAVVLLGVYIEFVYR